MTSKTKKIRWIDFSLLKAAEGGMSKTDALFVLREQGVRCRAGGYSPYVGHYSIQVDSRDEQKAQKILWG